MSSLIHSKNKGLKNINKRYPIELFINDMSVSYPVIINITSLIMKLIIINRPRYRYKDTIRYYDVGRKQGNLDDIKQNQRYNNRVWWGGFVHQDVTYSLG